MVIRSVHVQSNQQVARSGSEQRQATQWASQVALVVKNLPANAGDIRDVSLIPEGGNGNPLQYSCLENLEDRGPCRAIVNGVAESNNGNDLAHTGTHPIHQIASLGWMKELGEKELCDIWRKLNK